MRMRLSVAALILCLAIPGFSALETGPDAITAATIPAAPVVTTLVLTSGNPVMLVDGVRTTLEAAPFRRRIARSDHHLQCRLQGHHHRLDALGQSARRLNRLVPVPG